MIGFEYFAAGVESVSDIIAIKDKTAMIGFVQHRVDAVGNRTFATATEPRKPNDTAPWSVDRLFVPGNKCFFGHRNVFVG